MATVPVPRSGPQAIAALAAYVRGQLTRLDRLAPLGPLADTAARGQTAGRQFATAVVAAAAPFAPTSYSRARLIRQMHASGLLTDREARTTEAWTQALPETVVDVPTGAPR